jgi:hypothetical protein
MGREVMVGAVGWALRVVTAGALAVEAVIHLQLASNYQLAAPGGIGQGNLFRIEAVLALLAALSVLLLGSRITYLAAFAVGAGGLVAVVLYRYVNVPAIGPLPSMYEPVWFFKKTVTAVAEAVAAITALQSFFLAYRTDHRSGAEHHPRSIHSGLPAPVPEEQ